MKASSTQVALCSTCGGTMTSKGECLACLMRVGLDGSPEKLASLIFGDYEIARREDGSLWELGRGAMGVTYLADDKILHRSVALKVIDAPDANGAGRRVRERFLREARAAASFRHPNIAAVFHFGTTAKGDRCYYAMELVEGETLEALVRRDGPLTVEVALEMAAQVTRALVAAAAHSLIHRDLKPGNIMLTGVDHGRASEVEKGETLEVKVIDFGLAKAITRNGNEMDLTQGGFLGTPAFASPEQFSGAPADARSDIYSLGATLWYALTGEAPYEAKSIEEIRRCQTELALPFEKLRARKIPSLVIQLLRRALALDPAERPASARDFLRALEQCRASAGEAPGLFAELKRRNVYRVAAAYAVVGWLLIQITTQTFPVFAIPPWAVRLVILALIAGFPIALILAWAYELTPEGIKRTEEVAPHESIARRTGRKLDYAIIAVLALALGLLIFDRLRPAGPSAPVAPEKSIAVLPFTNISPEHENVYFADGIQDEILTTLAKVADLKVISRASVMQFRDAEKRNLPNIAQQLGVEHVLEGSVQRAGNRVRVNAQLVAVRSDSHLWAESYDGELADIFAIQSEIAQKIASQLKARLSPNERAALQAKPTLDTTAYDLYLRAREIWRHEGYQWGRQVPLLDEAVARDPSFVRALCMLAEVHLAAYWFNDDHTPARLELARKALEAAARLQPDAGEVHLARAVFHYWGNRDFAAALAELAVAARHLPNDTTIYFFTAFIERRQGRWEDSNSTMKRILVLDPRNSALASELANNYRALRRYDEARRLLDNVLAWKPDDAITRTWRARIDFFERADLKRLDELVSNPPAGADANRIMRTRGWVALLHRDYRAAEQAFAEYSLPDFADSGYVVPRQYHEGRIARGLGDTMRSEASFLVAHDRAAANVAARPDDAKALISLAKIDAALGRKEEALSTAERAVEMLPVKKDAAAGPGMLTQLAKVYAEVGEIERAVGVLEQAAALPFGPSYGELKLEEEFDPLRNDPRFQKILASLAPKSGN